MTTPQTEANGKIVKREPNGVAKAPAKNSLVDLITSKSMQAEIARALPRHVPADRMARIVLTALRTNPRLQECSPESFLGCVLQASQLGLEPNTPLQHCYLIPRKKKFKDGNAWREKMECTLLIGYQGQIELALRSGKVSSIYACAVREGDIFEHEKGLNPKLKHVPSVDPDREERPLAYVYTIARMTTGDPIWDVLSIAQIEARRKRSASRDEGPWFTDYEAMCLKTGVRSLFRWVPKSSEIARIEAMEVAADLGKGQLQTLDPGVTEALSRIGIAPIEHDEDGVVTDAEVTGVAGEERSPGQEG
jgi:recombination protein RecT